MTTHRIDKYHYQCDSNTNRWLPRQDEEGRIAIYCNECGFRIYGNAVYLHAREELSTTQRLPPAYEYGIERSSYEAAKPDLRQAISDWFTFEAQKKYMPYYIKYNPRECTCETLLNGHHNGCPMNNSTKY